MILVLSRVSWRNLWVVFAEFGVGFLSSNEYGVVYLLRFIVKVWFERKLYKSGS